MHLKKWGQWLNGYRVCLIWDFLCNFFSKIALHVFLNFMQSFYVTDLCRISYEVCMNFKQRIHVFLPKKENESSGKTMSNWQKTQSLIKSRELMPSVLWSPNLDKTGNISFLKICWYLIHMQSFLNLTCDQKFSYNRLHWFPLNTERAWTSEHCKVLLICDTNFGTS